ncbi:MAG: fructosamine kinase family protein [Cyanobacteriota bacterium]|nr:fructosamine kinase family protein [Cyanobacteriota bacterium]
MAVEHRVFQGQPFPAAILMVPSAADPLAAWLRERLGIELIGRATVGGGCIHGAWALRTAAAGPLFAKTNRADRLPLLEAEAEGLGALKRVAPRGLEIPEPLACGLAGELAVLVLPWLDFSRGADHPNAWEDCGANLARLHRLSLQAHAMEEGNVRFGWRSDNFIGTSPQVNEWQDNWATFFSDCRLRPQLRWLAAKGQLLRGADQLLEALPPWLKGHVPEPCLVHGDLWSGNAALLSRSGGSLFDPAIYRGDREVDLAMARLFKGFPQAFFKGYNDEWPLPDGWRERVDLYNLYHLLNHANLFGGGYINQAQTVIDSLLGLMVRI